MTHKAPVAINSCLLLNTTIHDLNDTVNKLMLKDSWLEAGIALGSNLVFNMADIYQEAFTLKDAISQQRWDQVGRYTAKIITDVFVKNPLDESWNFLNSESIGYRLQPKFDITKYTRLNVQKSVTKRLTQCLNNSEGEKLKGITEVAKNVVKMK